MSLILWMWISFRKKKIQKNLGRFWGHSLRLWGDVCGEIVLKYPLKCTDCESGTRENWSCFSKKKNRVLKRLLVIIYGISLGESLDTRASSKKWFKRHIEIWGWKTKFKLKKKLKRNFLIILRNELFHLFFVYLIQSYSKDLAVIFDTTTDNFKVNNQLSRKIINLIALKNQNWSVLNLELYAHCKLWML